VFNGHKNVLKITVEKRRRRPSSPAGWLNIHALFPANFSNMAKIPGRINFKIRARPGMLPDVDYCRRKCDCPKSEVFLTWINAFGLPSAYFQDEP
jgi:hypothetical protein